MWLRDLAISRVRLGLRALVNGYTAGFRGSFTLTGAMKATNPAPLAAEGRYDARPHPARPDDPAPERVLVTGLADVPECLITAENFAQMYAQSEIHRVDTDSPPPPDSELSVRQQAQRWIAEAPPTRPSTLPLKAPPGTQCTTLKTVLQLLDLLHVMRKDLFAALVSPVPVSALDDARRSLVATVLQQAYRILGVKKGEPQRLTHSAFYAIVPPMFAIAAAWRLEAVVAVVAHLTVDFLANKDATVIRTMVGAPDDLTEPQKKQLAHELDVVQGRLPEDPYAGPV